MLAVMAGIPIPGLLSPSRTQPEVWFRPPAALPCAAYPFDLSHFYGVSQMLPCIALMAEMNVLAA